jgi:hypothetical protein
MTLSLTCAISVVVVDLPSCTGSSGMCLCYQMRIFRLAGEQSGLAVERAGTRACRLTEASRANGIVNAVAWSSKSPLMVGRVR